MSRCHKYISQDLVLLQKSWLKTASTETGIYRFGGTSIIISGRLSKRNRPMLYAAIVALGSLPSVALPSTMADKLYQGMLLPTKR